MNDNSALWATCLAYHAGLDQGRALGGGVRVVTDHAAVSEAQHEIFRLQGQIIALRTAIDAHPDAVSIHAHAAELAPRYGLWTRLKGYSLAIIKVAGYALALNLIASKLFGY